MSGLDVSVVLFDLDDEEYVVDARVTLGEPASFRGHPDQWQPPEPGSVEILRVTCGGLDLDVADLELYLNRPRSQIEDAIWTEAEAEARRIDEEHDAARADDAADRAADAWMERGR